MGTMGIWNYLLMVTWKLYVKKEKKKHCCWKGFLMDKTVC